jgi:hypothetical protein
MIAWSVIRVRKTACSGDILVRYLGIPGGYLEIMDKKNWTSSIPVKSGLLMND